MIEGVEIQDDGRHPERLVVMLSLYPEVYQQALDPTLVIEDEVALIEAKCRKLITNWCKEKGLIGQP